MSLVTRCVGQLALNSPGKDFIIVHFLQLLFKLRSKIQSYLNSFICFVNMYKLPAAVYMNMSKGVVKA